ncbi:L-rhamnose mutarotase [Streptomyces sp. NPDC058067]|uniref:L-rhamnose mutarotase n=1 Tax=Streptomyces sp. NPDC058067 TaxID=3346324 RepID=UPI0036E5EC84
MTVRRYASVVRLRADLEAENAADTALIAECPVTRDWWARTEPCQQPLDSAGEGELWAPAEEVFPLE